MSFPQNIYTDSDTYIHTYIIIYIYIFGQVFLFGRQGAVNQVEVEQEPILRYSSERTPRIEKVALSVQLMKRNVDC